MLRSCTSGTMTLAARSTIHVRAVTPRIIEPTVKPSTPGAIPGSTIARPMASTA